MGEEYSLKVVLEANQCCSYYFQTFLKLIKGEASRFTPKQTVFGPFMCLKGHIESAFAVRSSIFALFSSFSLKNSSACPVDVCTKNLTGLK